MHRSFRSFTLLVLLTMAFAVAARDTHAQRDESDQREPLQKLLTERRDILQKRLDLIQEMHRNGTTTYKSVASATDGGRYLIPMIPPLSKRSRQQLVERPTRKLRNRQDRQQPRPPQAGKSVLPRHDTPRLAAAVRSIDRE